MGVEVAAEHARSAKIDGSAEIRVIPNAKGAVPLRSSLIFASGGRSRGVDTLRNDIVLLGVPSGAIMHDDVGTFHVDVEIENPARPGERRTLTSVLVDTGEPVTRQLVDAGPAPAAAA
jgi:hypothetical protein